MLGQTCNHCCCRSRLARYLLYKCDLLPSLAAVIQVVHRLCIEVRVHAQHAYVHTRATTTCCLPASACAWGARCTPRAPLPRLLQAYSPP